MFYIFLLLVSLVAFVTFIPVVRFEAWWIRGLDFPRLQFSTITLILLFAEWFLLDFSRPSTWGLLVVTLLCLGYQTWWIIPYTRVYPKEVKDAQRVDEQNRIKIMTANVLTTNRNSAGLIKLVRDHRPDVLVTLESDQWWQEKLDEMETDYPYTVKCPLDNLYGMHLYSKYALEDSKIEYLVEPDVPSIHTLICLPSKRKIRAHLLHPAPPSPTENEESSERDAELIMVAKSVARDEGPTIVTGDLNDVAWSETTRLFRKISGLLDPRVGRGMFNTYHAGYLPIRWPLDHIFHSSHFTLAEILRLPGFGSDHFALLTSLVLEPDLNNRDSGLDAETDDHDWADSKLKDQGAKMQDVPAPGKEIQNRF